MVKKAKKVAARGGGKVAVDPVQRDLAVINAKQQFVTSSFSMGWQLAITVIVPIVVGLKLDDYFGTAPSLTLGALVVATASSIAVISRTIKEVNREQLRAEKKERKKRGRRR